MAKEQRARCPATLKDGRPCPNAAKPERGGYCGIHSRAAIGDNRSAKERDERLARLLSTGTALILLAEKAALYLPLAIEVLVRASHIAFLTAHRPVFLRELD